MSKCEICGKEFNNKRPTQSLVLHMEKAHKMRKVGDKYIPIEDIEQPYEGQWRLLNPNDEIEKACMDEGYSECKETQGVSKMDWELR